MESPMNQNIEVVSRREAAKKFAAYLGTSPAAAVFVKFGFIVRPSPPGP